MEKKRGRKAGVGTLEAREYVLNNGLDTLLESVNDLSLEAKNRIVKAVKFGLGIKEPK